MASKARRYDAYDLAYYVYGKQNFELARIKQSCIKIIVTNGGYSDDEALQN